MTGERRDAFGECSNTERKQDTMMLFFARLDACIMTAFSCQWTG